MYETEREVIEILKRNKIDIVSTLPCEKISALLRFVARERAFCHVGLNREENGVGLSAGVCIAGGKPLMIIQSTGLGNSINAIMSLTVTYGLPLPIIASWRGVYKENIEAQVPFGMALPKVLDALGLKYVIIEDASQIRLVEEVIQDAFTNMPSPMKDRILHSSRRERGKARMQLKKAQSLAKLENGHCSMKERLRSQK